MTRKLATILATALWILGFVLAFLIPAGSQLFFVPDVMLLIGFWPLLWLWKPSWPWLIFGALNVFIGFVLQVTVFLPDADFSKEMLLVKKHLAVSHSPLTWILIGFASSMIGLFRIVKQLVLWLYTQAQKRRQ